MLRKFWLPATLGFGLAIGAYGLAGAVPVNPNVLSGVTSTPDVQLARAGRGGGRGGGMHRGGMHRGGRGSVAHRGQGFHGGGMRHGGRYGNVGRHGHGGYRVGGRYHGGTWYGTGRHFWRGRWYAYGVGACWRSSPIGYVWICG